MKREIATIGLVIGVLLIAAVGVPMVAAEGGVTRTLPATAAPGSTVTVSLAVTVGSATYYSIDEQVPAGWTVTGASGGGDTSDSGHVKWLVVGGAVDKTYTYTVNIPADASLGSYTFTGTYMLEGMTEEANISGDSSITVTLADTTPPAIEFIAPPTPADGSTVAVDYVTVTVSVEDSSGVSTVLLNWDGTNETMNASGLNTWSVDKTNLLDGTYAFKVYANDTAGNMGASETRTVIVSSDTYDPADTDHDREISMFELVTAIGWWKAGTPGYGISELMTTISRWKAGGY